MRRQSMKSTCIAALAMTMAGRQHQCRAGWVDPDTPEEFRTTTSNYAGDKREYELVRHTASALLAIRLTE